MNHTQAPKPIPRVAILLALTFNLFLFQAYSQSIIPKPVSMHLGQGEFIIDGNTSIKLNNTQLLDNAEFLKDYINSISGITLPVNSKSSKIIDLKISSIDSIGDEGYLLNIYNDSICISGNTSKGIFYGMQTIIQLLPHIRTNEALKLPTLSIVDYPRFKWRGMHLDVCRHFFSPEMVKKYIDLISSYKMNTFHWHLCDDQGWRIEIKKYPKLTSVGAWRVDRLNKVWNDREPAKQDETPTYGGYYTQEQIKDIVEYARKRSITIVPEIEMPGHSSAALAAYPNLSCSGNPQPVVTGGQYASTNQSNYCIGNDDVFVFLKDVLSEVIELFPSKYIHIGGDEVDKTDWKQCPKCQAKIKQLGLKDENELQSYCIREIEEFLLSKNRRIIGWDEILEGGLAPEATVMSWRGEKGGIEAAKMKHEVIMTPGTPCYLDFYQAGPEGEPIAIGGFNTLKKVYDYEPIPQELSDEEGKFVLGAQGNIWTEFIPTVSQLEYMLMPRMTALAEVFWSKKGSKDWVDFNNRLQNHFRFYDQLGLNYCMGNFKVDIKTQSQEGTLAATLSSEIPNSEIYYTTDGTAPSLASNKYTAPIPINSSMTLKASTFVYGYVKGLIPAEQKYTFHKAIGRNVKYEFPISQKYQADGPNSLTDGIRGNFTPGKYWHGINGKDLIATVDLGSKMSIRKVSIGFLQKYSSWIFLPQSVTIEISSNGKKFKKVSEIPNTVDVNLLLPIIKDFEGKFSRHRVRYIRITAKNIGVCPKGHRGEGQPAWLFADEIIVE